MPYIGEFHFTALSTLGTHRTTSASRRFPRSRFHPGIAAMYACTGASPSAFAICGLPPESRTTAAFSRVRALIGLAALAPAFGEDLADALRGLLTRDAGIAFGFGLRRITSCSWVLSLELSQALSASCSDCKQ